MTLNYLLFDHSEDTDGTGTFEAMASVAPARLPQVQAEVDEVLHWAFAAFPGSHGPVSEGFAWDHDLQSQREPGTPPLHTITLSLSGTPPFCEAFQARFELG